MPSHHLLIFLQPHDDDRKTHFLSWRKEILSEGSAVTRSVYLDAADDVIGGHRYCYVNSYHFKDLASFADPRVQEQLQYCFASADLKDVQWQLYETITEARKPQSLICTPSIFVSVGMTIPADQSSQNELHEWYEKEHIPALSSVLGWQACLRLRLVRTSDENSECKAPYLAFHEWGEPNDMGGETWKKAILTPGTPRITALQSAPMYRRVWKVSS